MSVAVNQAGLPSPFRQVPGFFRVSQLVPDDQDVVTIPVGTTVGDALNLMRTHSFDQLPVITAGNRVVGTFTHRSFARELRSIRPQDNPLSVPVDDLVEDLQFVRSSHHIDDILGFLEIDHAVLVGDEDRLLAIVTATDLNRFLWDRTRPFVLLQDIELAVRDLMRSSCTADELVGSISVGLPLGPDRVSARLEDLTLSELFSVLLHGPSFGRFFRICFRANRELVRATLEPVVEIRNKVFHFRDEVSGGEVQTLIDVTNWLRRKILTRDGER
ncbi:CBS domain-containing protein [Amycolatopsis sp. WGS_07]|uniref:CBS domain-containing protein n=1 Tax=Amycolatopsis sp. WGS_07 TaxID=3076764 RepID=UPI0038733E2C